MWWVLVEEAAAALRGQPGRPNREPACASSLSMDSVAQPSVTFLDPYQTSQSKSASEEPFPGKRELLSSRAGSLMCTGVAVVGFQERISTFRARVH